MLVGEYDRLRAPARADHDWLGVGAVLAEALQQGRQLGAHLARHEHIVGLTCHGPCGAYPV